MNVGLRPSLHFISLCTGGGGLDLGIELAVPDARACVLVEREAFACAQLVSAMEAGLLAPAPLWSDVTTFRGREWRGLVDGVIGGIPCQPHSLAGKRLGQDDERDLWTDTRRIVVQSRPWFCLIENVSGMLGAPKGQIPSAERVWRDLQRLGYQVEGGLFRASEVGAPHERERIFILGVADASYGQFSQQGRRPQGRAGAGSDPSIERWGEGRPELAGRDGNAASAIAGGGRRGLRQQQHVAHADGDEPAALGRDAGEVSQSQEGQGGPEHGPAVPRGRGDEVGLADTDGGRQQGERQPQHGEQQRALWREPDGRGAWHERNWPLFPPGPADVDAWRAILAERPDLSPAIERQVRDLAHGLASRVDELRMLGNGVVPLQAAHAFRTLCARLAARGSAGATKLMGMMGEQA